MDWMLRLTSSVVFLLLLAPFAVLLVGLMLFGLVGHLLPRSLIKSKTSFDCPHSRRHATVEFLSSPETGQLSDVLSCSVFSDPYEVSCKKGCLTMIETGWQPSPMMPRYALLANGLAYRATASPEPVSPGETSRVD
jgi:hypothetical protein